MNSVELKPGIRSSDHHRGPLTAPVQVVEYGDFECGFCGAAFPEIERFVKKLGDQVCFAFRHFPIVNSHPHALMCATAAEAAARQNKFWPMHHLLFQNQKTLSTSSILHFAQLINLDMTRFREDINDPDVATHIQNDFQSGVRNDVNGTPTLYMNGYKLTVETTYESLLLAAEEFLPEPKSGEASLY